MARSCRDEAPHGPPSVGRSRGEGGRRSSSGETPDDELLVPPPDAAPEHALVEEADDTPSFMCCHESLTRVGDRPSRSARAGSPRPRSRTRSRARSDHGPAHQPREAADRASPASAFAHTPTDGAWRAWSPSCTSLSVFNEGYATSEGAELARVDLSGEAIRPPRGPASLAADGEVTGPRIDAPHRRAAVRALARNGELILPRTSRSARSGSLDDRRGVALISETLSCGGVGPYQLQAAIAAVHDEATTPSETDWPQILAPTACWSS